MLPVRSRYAGWLAAWLAALTLAAAEVAAPSEPAWGKALRSIQIGIAAGEPVRMLGRVSFTATMRIPADALTAEELARATQYAVVAQHQRAWFTEARPLELSAQTDGPLTGSIDVGELAAGRYQPGMATEHGYPVLEADAKAAGRVNELVGLGPVVVVWLVCLPATAERPELLLRSGSLTLEAGTPDLEKLSPERRAAFVAGVVKGFRGSAADGKWAHGLASRLGPAMVPPLRELADDPAISEHSRMWLATALADLGGNEAGKALTAMMSQAPAGVRNVIAYHGPKCRSAALDEAIVTATESGGAELIAWALRGYAGFRKELPSRLLDLGQRHEKAELRATVVEVLTQCPGPDWKPRVLAFLGDPHPRVRGAAAVAAARLDYRDEPFLEALVHGLAETDDEARRLICQTLSSLTGEAHLFDPEADEAARKATVAWWEAWLARRAKTQ